MTNTALNFKTAPGHEVLAAAGKRMLRPGGNLLQNSYLNGRVFSLGRLFWSWLLVLDIVRSPLLNVLA